MSVNRWISNGAMICNRAINRKWQYPIRTYVGDKAGTELDGLGLAATHAISGGFSDYGVKVTTRQVRQLMGGAKIKHVEGIRNLPEVNEQFKKKFGAAAPNTEEIFSGILPQQLKILKNPKYGNLLPGVLSTMNQLKDWGIDRTATTGYTVPMARIVLSDQEKQGYIPNVNVASDEVGRGRPWPLGIWRCMLKVGNGNVQSVLKVDDTKEGGNEGLGAGCPTVITIKHGNLMGNYFDSLEEMEGMEKSDPKGFEVILNKVREEAKLLNPDFIIDTMESLPDVVRYINQKSKINNSYPHQLPFQHILTYIQKCTRELILNPYAKCWPNVAPFVYLESATEKDQIYCALEFIKMVDEEYKISLAGNLPNFSFLKQIKNCLAMVKADEFESMGRAYLSDDLFKLRTLFGNWGIVLPY